MIGRLQGLLLAKQPPHLLVDVQGVGYELQAPMSTFYQLAEIGQTVILHTHLAVREDAHQLYGFAELRERQLFRALLKVNGVGPKLALGILSSLEPDVFVLCIVQADEAALAKVPGIGKKTAQRLIVEMRDRLEDWHSEDSALSTPSLAINPSIPDPLNEAVSALVALGYRPQDATRAVAKVKTPGLRVEEVIRLALKSGVVA